MMNFHELMDRARDGDARLLGAQMEDAPWPELDVSLLDPRCAPPPTLPLDVFGPFWSAILTAWGEATSTEPDYPAGALLSTASALIGNSLWISPWQGWTEPPVLWFAVVGSPSAGKSPALKAVLDPLAPVEAELAVDHEDTLAKYEGERETAKLTREQWLKDVKEAKKQGLPAPREPNAAREPDRPARPRVRVNDATTEALCVLLAGLPRGVLFDRDELAGWLGNFDRYGGSGGDRAFWLEARNGGSYRVDRVKHGDVLTIPRVSVAVLGGIQPDRLHGALLKGDDDGLPARFLYVWPERRVPERPQAVPNVAAITAAYRRLIGLDFAYDAHGQPLPRVVRLTAPAADRFVEWRKGHAMAEPTGGLYASWWGKGPGVALRLALVLTCLRWAGDTPDAPPPEVIDLTTLDDALRLLDGYLKPMAERCFGDAAIPEAERHAALLARWLVRTKLERFNARKLRRGKAKPQGVPNDAGKIAAALDELTASGWVRPDPTRVGGGAGRGSSDYHVNPAVRTLDG